MALIYEDKGPGLLAAITDAGYNIVERDGVWEAVPASAEASVQAIIDTYDPLPYYKKVQKRAVRREAVRRSAVVYPFLSAFLAIEVDDATDTETVNSFYQFAQDIYLSILPAARGSLQPRLEDFKDIRDRALVSVSFINDETDWTVLRDYDPVNDPIWP